MAASSSRGGRGGNSHRSARIKITDDILRYDGGGSTSVGCMIMPLPLADENNYFEIKIINSGVAGCISIGLAPFDYPLDSQPGWRFGSVAFHADDGRLYKCSGQGKAFGPRCKVGDRMGCGVRKPQMPGVYPGQNDMLVGLPLTSVQVYFTRNGDEIGSTNMIIPDHSVGLHPAIGMHSDGEVVEITIRPGSPSMFQASSMDDYMLVDDTEDEWIKTHDVRVNGQVIEYTGNGVHIHDVGLAQAKQALNTTNHYFEIEILEPGEHCYIAIGLIHKDYPLHRHPGWNVGSIAYHADDGKIFLGRGQGTPFGPKCYRGDVMGCGIQYPFEYVTPSDDEEDDDDIDLKPPQGFDDLDLQDDLLASGDEDDFFWPQYGKLDDLPWAPRVVDGEEPLPMDFIIEPGMGRGNMERWFDDSVRRGYRKRVFMRGGMRGLHGGAQPPAIYGRKERGMMVKVFFTRNGCMIGHKDVMMPKGGFYPSVGMLSANEKVKVELHPLSG